MGGISMAVKFRHKETGLFFCRAKGLSPSRRDYDKLGEEGIFRKRHLSKRGRIYESATENQKRDWIGGFLSEFYWVNGKHHIYIREECKGLLPDDDRYSCLIYEMNKVSSDEERINSYGKEYFFNFGDRFERKLKIGL